MDFNDVSPGYSTTPRDRLVAHLARDLPRHLPHVEFDEWRAAGWLADLFVTVVGEVDLEGHPGAA